MNKNEEPNYGMRGCIGVLIIIAGVLIKLFYTGTFVDKHAVSETFGTSKNGNIIALLAIGIMKMAASAWGYLVVIAIGSYVFITSIISAIKK